MSSPRSRLIPGQGVAKNVDLAVVRAMAIAATIKPSRGGVSSSSGYAQYVAENFKTRPYPSKAESPYRTFFAESAGADILVSAGAVGHVIVPATTITAPADGDLIWLWVEIDDDLLVIDAEVRSGSSIPADTATEGHIPLASVSAAASVATPTPVGWNYSQVQYCGGQYIWGTLE